jgi:chromosome partitioning protein
MITVVGGMKGGTGKSTIATNLAVLYASRGRDVLLVDADQQETSTLFTNMRNRDHPTRPAYTCVALAGRAVLTEVRRLAPKYDEVIIDSGGSNEASRRGALAVSEICLLPFAPRSFDVWTLDNVAAIVEEARGTNPGLAAYALINRADAQGGDNSAAAALIESTPGLQLVPTSLGARKSFARAASSGLGVTEIRPSDPKAVEEVGALLDFLDTLRTQ